MNDVQHIDIQGGHAVHQLPGVCPDHQEAVQCSSIMNHLLPIHLILYAWVITRALQETQNSSGNPLICVAAVVEDKGTRPKPKTKTLCC